MAETALKNKLSNHTGEFMAALLLIQPLLDVLSYFMQEAGTTTVTTALRTVLLFSVSFYGFAVSGRKQAYAACYGLVAGFWLLHMLNCFRVGYAHPVADAAEYLKLVQFPLWTLSFITFLRNREGLDAQIVGILAADFMLILLVIGISYLVGMPAYTYDFPERGIQIGLLGWFGVPNAQSAILCMLLPPLLLWGFRSKKLWLFCVVCGFGFALLYFTGTRLTFYGAVLTAAVFLVLILFDRRQYLFCLPLLVALALLMGLRGMSPMAQRQALTADSYAVYQEKTDAIMGEDKDFVYREGEELSNEVQEKIRRVYLEIYGQEGLYGAPLLGDLIDRFGVDAVMEKYRYSIKPEMLYNGRVKKRTAVAMVWEEKDFLTKLLGIEYSEATLGGNIYDPENDFPALLYYEGYLGAGLYLCFILYFLWLILAALLKNIRYLPALLTPEVGVYLTMAAMALGAALFSGQALRKPSVTVYFSLSAALLYNTLRPLESPRIYREYGRAPVVTLKKV